MNFSPPIHACGKGTPIQSPRSDQELTRGGGVQAGIGTLPPRETSGKLAIKVPPAPPRKARLNTWPTPSQSEVTYTVLPPGNLNQEAPQLWKGSFICPEPPGLEELKPQGARQPLGARPQGRGATCARFLGGPSAPARPCQGPGRQAWDTIRSLSCGPAPSAREAGGREELGSLSPLLRA